MKCKFEKLKLSFYSNQDSVISCVVPGGAGVVKVKVHIDGNVVETEGGNFSYMEDPTVLNIDPLKAFER